MLLKVTLLSFLALSLLAVAQQAPPAIAPAAPQSSSVSVQENVSYGIVNGEKLLLDVYSPPADPRAKTHPAVILVHGGSWSGGDKETMSRMASFLARSGYVAVAVNYRLLHGDENRWPAQLDDVQRSVRWVRAKADKLNVDPKRIGAFGHSAGAQIAALLGMEDTRDNSDAALRQYSSRVQAVVDVDGPVDFVPMGDAHDNGGLLSMFGGSYEKIPNVWREASPVYQVAKSNAPFLIIHGTQDDIVPMSQAEEFYDKLQKAGVPVELIKIDDGHTFTTPEAKRRMAFASLMFFDKYLGKPADQGK